MSCNKISENKYLDQVHEKAFLIDPFKHEVIQEEDHPVDLMEEVKDLVRHLSKDVQAYTDKYYKEPNGSQGTLPLTQSSRKYRLG